MLEELFEYQEERANKEASDRAVSEPPSEDEDERQITGAAADKPKENNIVRVEVDTGNKELDGLCFKYQIEDNLMVGDRSLVNLTEVIEKNGEEYRNIKKLET